ncbi:hypothetical protein [Methanosarcina mazei]|uniref:Uncharacterized protein n=1 Tax=Methanosarcina mazei TaxID=2209 RepID=A0A0F8GRC6_METMZ|nr:hypothetical protein [Methanosarcina mazei]KKG34925.1 hypothetical protein DU30_00175 [Methanosarcina mazei]KKG64504.1 hypothetical protein DU67_07515 [Methanosarcina mazei]
MLYDKDIKIGRSIMKCLLYEIEDDITIDNECNEENLRLQLRGIKLFFEAMDRMGIKTVNKEVYDCMMSMGYDHDFAEQLATDDELQIEEYCTGFEHWTYCHPDYFEYGEPETEIPCDDSCRHTAKLVSKGIPTDGVIRSVVAYMRPSECVFRDML